MPVLAAFNGGDLRARRRELEALVDRLIAGKPVYAETSVTATPSFSSSFAVPPVDRIEKPRPVSARANSTMPALSETLISACRRATR